MYILAFDTTAAQCSIVLQQNDKEIAKFCSYMDFGQSEVLVPQIAKMLKEVNITFADIGMVLVCVGAGSFTGVRASISAARTFQLAHPGLILDGITAFDAYVTGLNEQERAEVNTVIIETKRDDFYIQLFDKNLQKITSPQALHYDDIIPLLRGKKVSLTGDGVERFLAKNSGLSLHCIKMPEALDVSDMIKIGQKHLADKKFDYPKPLYLRAPDVCLPKHQ